MSPGGIVVGDDLQQQQHHGLARIDDVVALVTCKTRDIKTTGITLRVHNGKINTHKTS
jgi:hypothetical protein